MHDSLKLRLEEYLQGGARMPEMDDHLRQCARCREEVEAMRMQSLLLRSLKAPEMDPGAGFYAKVLGRIEKAESRPSVWSLFGESLFARRLMYASAMFLVLLGSFAISNEEESVAEPVSILAGNEAPAPVTMESARDREVVLVTLATWGSGQSESPEQDWQ